MRRCAHGADILREIGRMRHMWYVERYVFCLRASMRRNLLTWLYMSHETEPLRADDTYRPRLSELGSSLFSRGSGSFSSAVASSGLSELRYHLACQQCIYSVLLSQISPLSWHPLPPVLSELSLSRLCCLSVSRDV